jgi:hypothetical protein
MDDRTSSNEKNLICLKDMCMYVWTAHSLWAWFFLHSFDLSCLLIFSRSYFGQRLYEKMLSERCSSINTDINWLPSRIIFTIGSFVYIIKDLFIFRENHWISSQNNSLSGLEHTKFSTWLQHDVNFIKMLNFCHRNYFLIYQKYQKISPHVRMCDEEFFWGWELLWAEQFSQLKIFSWHHSRQFSSQNLSFLMIF